MNAVEEKLTEAAQLAQLLDSKIGELYAAMNPQREKLEVNERLALIWALEMRKKTVTLRNELECFGL